ncbi:MAG: DUF4367 domain-containing protein [Candidatus Methanoperedens sp.]|nr:DUF4367 domain-containing protein [Candidatus Methanoperedens sp.]
MRNKIIMGAIIAIVLLSAAVIWYFTPSDVSIVKVEASKELLIGQLGQLTVFMQNNASKDANVTIDVKNSFVDAKGVSLKGVAVLSYENLSYTPSNTSNVTDISQKEILLKPGFNSITYMVGYESPGLQKVEVDIYQYGKLIDSRTVEINIPKPKIAMNIWNQTSINGTNEIYSVYGDLEIFGQGYAPGVVVNISVVNELTNTTVSTVTRSYSLNSESNGFFGPSEPLVTWETRNSVSDPVTGMQTTIYTETFAPIIVIELSKGNPSDEKYILSPIVIKGKVGDRYKVVATARWINQVVSSEMMIPSPPVREKTVEEAIADAQAEVSFKILQPGYIPEGYRMNTAGTSGTKFHGFSSELEQALLSYTRGNEYLNLQELLVIKDDTDVSGSFSKTPYKFVDINGTQGRFLEEESGMKSLNWKEGSLSLTISSYAYNGSSFTGTSLGMDEMIKVARSVK